MSPTPTPDALRVAREITDSLQVPFLRTWRVDLTVQIATVLDHVRAEERHAWMAALEGSTGVAPEIVNAVVHAFEQWEGCATAKERQRAAGIICRACRDGWSRLGEWHDEIVLGVSTQRYTKCHAAAILDPTESA